MRVLGISAHAQDASASLVQDGRLVASAREESFTRQRRDPNFPRFAIEYCLDLAGVAAHELDAIAFFEEPQARFTRVLTQAFGGFPTTLPTFVATMKDWLGTRLWTGNTISARLDVHPDKIAFVPRHLSQAAQGFLTSPFDRAAVLVVDSAGAWSSTTLMSATTEGGCLDLESLEQIPFPHSLGLVQAAFTALLGFRVHDEEHLLQDLAAHGEPHYVGRLRKILAPEPEGTYRVDPSYFRFDRLEVAPCSRPWTHRLTDLLGAARDARRPLPFSTPVGARTQAADPEDQRHADVARSLQEVMGECAVGLCRRLRDKTGLDQLCLTGGVALDPVLRRRVRQEGGFAAVHVPVDPGDGGCSAGAALYVDALAGRPFRQNGSMTPFLGPAFDEQRDGASLAHTDPTYWQRFRRRGCRPVRGLSLDVTRADEVPELWGPVADDLADGCIVGWSQGRAETGPHPLGRRSILVDPSNITSATRLRERVTGEPALAPPTLLIREEDADVLFEEAPPTTARWLPAIATARPAHRKGLAAVLDPNHQARVVLCSARDNPELHGLLGAFGEKTGTPALLNAGLHEPDQPLAASPADALLIFMRTEMDTVVTNQTLARKVWS